MSVKVNGDEELRRNLLALGKDMDKALAQGVFLTANEVRNHAVKSIQKQSFGTWTKRSRQGGGGTYDHIAAAPGNAPNTDTGKLVNSIAVEMDWDARKAEVGSNLDYAAYLEFGTEHKSGGVKMLPRPFLQPALDAVSLDDNLRKVVLATIKKRAKK